MASRMYFLVNIEVDIGHAMLAMAHGATAASLKFKDNPEYQDWIVNSFRKCCCGVTAEQMHKAKTYGLDHIVMTESAIPGVETLLVFSPRTDWPQFFRSLPLYKGPQAANLPII